MFDHDLVFIEKVTFEDKLAGQDTLITYYPDFVYFPPEENTFNYRLEYDIPLKIGVYKQDDSTYLQVIKCTVSAVSEQGAESLPSMPYYFFNKEVK
jgi:hypothetical protein